MLVTLIVRCRGSKSFYFEGFYQGKKVKSLISPGHGLKRGHDYLLKGFIKDITNGVMNLNIIQSKELVREH